MPRRETVLVSLLKRYEATKDVYPPAMTVKLTMVEGWGVGVQNAGWAEWFYMNFI